MLHHLVKDQALGSIYITHHNIYYMIHFTRTMRVYLMSRRSLYSKVSLMVHLTSSVNSLCWTTSLTRSTLNGQRSTWTSVGLSWFTEFSFICLSPFSLFDCDQNNVRRLVEIHINYRANHNKKQHRSKSTLKDCTLIVFVGLLTKVLAELSKEGSYRNRGRSSQNIPSTWSLVGLEEISILIVGRGGS